MFLLMFESCVPCLFKLKAKPNLSAFNIVMTQYIPCVVCGQLI